MKCQPGLQAVIIRLVLLAGVIAAVWYGLPHIDDLARDGRLAWAALLPAVYVLGMLTLMKE